MDFLYVVGTIPIDHDRQGLTLLDTRIKQCSAKRGVHVTAHCSGIL